MKPNDTWEGLGFPDHVQVVLREHILNHGKALRDNAKSGNWWSVQSFLVARQNPDEQDRHGKTALYLASKHGHLEVVELLLLAGSDPDLAPSSRTSPVFSAFASNHTDIVQKLHLARADTNNFGKLVAERGCEINCLLPQEDTCLWRAVQCGLADGVGSLLMAAADPNFPSWMAPSLCTLPQRWD